MYAEPTDNAPDLSRDFNRKARLEMGRAVKRAALLKVQLSSVRAVNLSGSRGAGCPTTPANLKCWIWDIEMLLNDLSRVGSDYFVDRQARNVVWAVEVQGRRFRDVSDFYGITRGKVGEIMDQAASKFWQASIVYGKTLNPFEEA